MKISQLIKLENRHTIDFENSSSQAFRQHLYRLGSQKIKTRGNDTFMYDRHGQIIAKMTRAHIDKNGKTTPVQYFTTQARRPEASRSNIPDSRSWNALQMFSRALSA
jgi:hypothetical protein